MYIVEHLREVRMKYTAPAAVKTALAGALEGYDYGGSMVRGYYGSD